MTERETFIKNRFKKFRQNPSLIQRGRTKKGRGRRGLTFVEIIIVLAVIAIMMGILYAAINPGAVFTKTKRFEVVAAASQLSTQWVLFEEDYGRLEEGTKLTVLSEKSSEYPGWIPIGKKLTVDPWDHPYFICLDEEGTRQICSYGADGTPGGTDTDSDFYLTDETSWPQWLSKEKDKE